eukprot:3735289-Prymnesium_polylepis.1
MHPARGCPCASVPVSFSSFCAHCSVCLAADASAVLIRCHTTYTYSASVIQRYRARTIARPLSVRARARDAAITRGGLFLAGKMVADFTHLWVNGSFNIRTRHGGREQ